MTRIALITVPIPAVLALALGGCTGASKTSAPVVEDVGVHANASERVEKIAVAVDLYLQAYRAAIETNGGEPDYSLWTRAVSNSPQAAAFVHDAMDVTFGFDFVHPPALDPEVCGPADPARPGDIRAVEDVPAALALMDALREDLGRAIRELEPERVGEQMDAFWAGAYWYYHPMHTGRCYPHGHDFYTGTPGDCIENEVEGALSIFLAEQLTGEPAAVAGLMRQCPSTGSCIDRCDCYWSSDCGDNGSCSGYGFCSQSGKLDGTCLLRPDFGVVRAAVLSR